MIKGMHLTTIGKGKVLLEPNEGLDPTDPDAYLESLLEYLQEHQARQLIYDLKNQAIIDAAYYDWLLRLDAMCRISGIELVTVQMQPPAAYALSLTLSRPPPFSCALDVDRVR